MRILMIQPNYHAGGAEIAGNWPPGWVAYVGGALKAKGVLKNYARFYVRKTFFDYPWTRDRFKRRYLLGCLKAFAKTTATKKFYDLGRLKMRGVSTQVEFGFDADKVLDRDALIALRNERPDLQADVDFAGTVGAVAMHSEAPAP